MSALPVASEGITCMKPSEVLVLHETLATVHERDNVHDHYTIAARKGNPGSHSHRINSWSISLKERSRITRYIILHGAIVSVTVINTNYRRSPLVQGGLEIPVEVKVTMNCSPKNKETLVEYEDLVHHYCKEPVEETFEDATSTNLEDLYRVLQQRRRS